MWIIEEIELMLRTQLSYYHAHKYGPLGYKNKNNFYKIPKKKEKETTEKYNNIFFLLPLHKQLYERYANH